MGKRSPRSENTGRKDKALFISLRFNHIISLDGWTAYCLTIVLLSQTAVWCYSIHHQASMASAQQCSLQSNKKTIFIFHSPGVNPSWEIKTSSMIHSKHLWARATLLYIRLCLSWFPTRSLGKRGRTASPSASSGGNGAAESSLPRCTVPR